MGLKIREKEDLYSGTILTTLGQSCPNQLQHLQTFSPHSDQRGRFIQHHNTRLEALQQQSNYLQHHYYGETLIPRPANFSVEHYFPLENYSSLEMSFGNLPVLEDDVVSEILESTNVNTFEEALSNQHTYRQSNSIPLPISRDLSFKNLSSPTSRRDLIRYPCPIGERERWLGLVTLFPHKERLEGFDFEVSFPLDSPKLVVTKEGEQKRIHSINDSFVALFFNHKAGPKAKIRFLVVFTSDGESTSPVYPCRNHQHLDHPKHIFEVSGVCEDQWGTSPHPSILVVPCGTNGATLTTPLTSQNPPAEGGEPLSCAQLKFLCRNSCLTRKDLTLICQLERDNEVLARESFLLKVSACPRRDAKAKKGLWDEMGNKLKRKRPLDSEVSRPFKRPSLSTDEDNDSAEEEKEKPNVENMVAMVTESKNTAFMNVMTSAFEYLHPEQFVQEKKKFEITWKHFINDKANDL